MKQTEPSPKKQSPAPPEKDNAWKDLLNQFFREFMEFFFVPIAADIGWQRGYEFLDKELEQITRDHRIGRRLADKLVKVWLRDGSEQWLLIHLEVQGALRRGFTKRIYVYNYRIFDKYDTEVISLVLLTDSPRPSQLMTWKTGRWDCDLTFRFPVISLADYETRWDELEASRNPFALAVMAHLRVKQAHGDNLRKFAWKRELIFRLYERGYTRQEIYAFFRFLDWVMSLSPELEEKLKTDIDQYKEGKRMPYISTWERLVKEDGRVEGIEQGTRNILLRLLQRKFGDINAGDQARIAELPLSQLDKLSEALLDFTNAQQLTTWLNRHTRRKKK